MFGAGTHSNGYCRRFSLHSLFILHRVIGDSETFATAFCLLGIFDTKKNAILYLGYFTVMNHTYLI